MINNNRIVVVGSCNTDMVVQSERLPDPGETILGGDFLMNSGGKGANQAVAAARLGGRVSLISRLGNDIFGKKMLEQYNAEEINTDFVYLDEDVPSGVALINVDAKGENTIVVASGANAALSFEDVDSARSTIISGKILLLQLEIPMETVEYVARLAYENGLKVVLNPAPAVVLSNELLKCIDTLIPNKTEAELLSGVKIVDIETAKKAADVIADKGVEKVVITLGEQGSLIKNNGNFIVVPANKVEVVDTTAAGDTFCGAYCVGISEGLSIEDSVKFATKAAGITVTRKGAQDAIPFRNELGTINSITNTL